MSDIRKWFMKKHDKGSGSAAKAGKIEVPAKPPPPEPKKEPVQETQDVARRRKTSKYFSNASSEPNSKQTAKEENAKAPLKRKLQKTDEDLDDIAKKPPAKKTLIDEDDDFVSPITKKINSEAKPVKKSKIEAAKKAPDVDEDAEDEIAAKTPVKSGGRGRGGRGSGAATAAGRGRGGGRGGFMNFGERKDPPHKGEKEVPEGSPDCLAGLTFVISGTLDSLEREEAEDLIKRHGGRVTGSVSKRTSFLLADEDIGGNKSTKAKELGTTFLTEDGLFDMIRKSKPVNASVEKTPEKRKSETATPLVKSSPMKKDGKGGLSNNKVSTKKLPATTSPSKRKGAVEDVSSLTWTEKYKPKVPNDIVGNQSLVKQLHNWLSHWNEQFLHTGQKGKGKKQNDNAAKKAVLLSGSPGIGKTTSAKLVSQMLGFQAIEVNASDSRGKADSKIVKGIGGSRSNSVKELVSNEALDLSKDWSKHPKTVLIMDEVDGMSAGDRGGVADLIASIKISKIPIICICNDRYSQKLKSLINYCLLLNYRKPTKQQMAKRLMQIASAEGIQTNEIALEELGDRVNGDMRMAINQLQYMSLSNSSVIKYDTIRERLLNSSKDEDISPFTAVDKLFSYNGGKLRMDERIDLCMSDPDLVPLIIQENYLNYRPSSVAKNDSARMELISRSAESISDGDIINVQIRRYRQWQLSQAGSFASCIIPASLLRGSREILEPGERNYNRFGGWLGKNSTAGKNVRLLQDVHVHMLASQESNLDRDILRVDYFPLILRQLTDPLRVLPKDAAVQKVVEFMDAYSLSQEDFDTIIELSKFHGHPSPLEGVAPPVKAALTKAYKQGSNSRVIRVADFITLPGLKKAPKKRIAAILEPVEDGATGEEDDALLENEEGNSSDIEDNDATATEQKIELGLQTDKSKGIQVQLELKNSGNSNAKKAPARKSKASATAQKAGSSSSSVGKRKR